MRKADNLPLSCAVVTKSGDLNFLEPSGPVQACNGTALHFTSVFRNEVVNIPIFWDIVPCRLAVTDVSEKRKFSIFRMKQNNYVFPLLPHRHLRPRQSSVQWVA